MSSSLLALLLVWSFAARSEAAPAQSEAAAYLSDLVRIRTENPPGGERAACDYLAGVLRLADIPFEIHESTPGRANLIARFKGSGKKKPLLLVAHLDTVGVEEERWSFPPFAGDIKDGYVRGRGAIDDKGMAAAFLTILLRLKRDETKLSRDVIFAAVADEESGGRFGVRWLLGNVPALKEAEFAINEGGLTVMDAPPIGAERPSPRVRMIALQTSEKAYYDVRLTARGVSGHASVPHPGNAIAMLARALARVADWRPPPRLNAVTRPFFDNVAPHEGEPIAGALKDVLSEEPERVERGLQLLDAHAYYSAMLHDTVVPTMIDGGIRENVVASQASANLNARLLPDTDPEEFLESLVDAIDEPGVEVEIVARPPGPAPAPMPTNSALYTAFAAAGQRAMPGGRMSPFMSVGSTDSEFLRRAGILTYGFAFPLTAQEQARIHGHDERMPVAGLEWGVAYLLDVIKEVGK